jgi:hypothetical protein
LKNRYFFNEKSPSYIILILEKTSFSKENVLVLPEFLKNKYFVKGKSPKTIRILENKYFLNEKSPKAIYS